MRNEHLAQRDIRFACVSHVASRQWGNITTRQLLDCGVGRKSISRWVATKRLHRVYRGVYAVGHRSRAPEARWAAALLYCGTGAALSHCTALALAGLAPPPQIVDVTSPRKVRPQPGLRVHSPSVPLQRDELTRAKGLSATTIPRTLLDLAADGRDVDRLVADAVARRLTSLAVLRAYVASRSGVRGVAGLRRGIEEGRAWSGKEREFCRWLRSRGLPVPELNEEIGPFTVDGIWREAGLVIEIDTYVTHGTPHSFENDRLRDAYLAGQGLRTIRVTPHRWRHDGDRLAADIRRALARR